MRNARIIILACFVTLFAAFNVYAGGDDVLYARAVEAVKMGKKDFAFMYFGQIDRDFPSSRYREQALLAKGEYLFGLPALTQSVEVFKAIVREYPKSQVKLFALAYLYKIAEIQNDTSTLENLNREILTFRQVGLVFKETKEIKYPSPFYRNFKAVFFIDKIEFYRGGELFATVSNYPAESI